MSGAERGDTPDQAWLNDHSEYQRNFVHGLRNPSGLHLQYHLAGDRVVTSWVASEEHAGFPGFVHGGLIAAVLDDVMGRCSVLQRRWVVPEDGDPLSGGAPLGAAIRREGDESLHAPCDEGGVAMSLEDGTVVAEATGTYLPVPDSLLERMVVGRSVSRKTSSWFRPHLMCAALPCPFFSMQVLGAEHLAIEFGNFLRGLFRHGELDKRQAEIDVAEARGVGLVDVRVCRPTGRSPVRGR